MNSSSRSDDREGRERSGAPERERLAALALAPILVTGFYYALPAPFRDNLLIQFLPQLLAYLGLAIWASRNSEVVTRLGLSRDLAGQGLWWGLPTGLILGTFNAAVMLWLVPLLGGDIQFLRETPHARVPAVLMLPWVIALIAIAIELNFRGFLLGRLLALCAHPRLGLPPRVRPILAVGISALVFSFDPFMVATFKHLHWIAVWDGLIWGGIWLHLRNLYAPITAHAVEVLVTYSVLKAVLS